MPALFFESPAATLSTPDTTLHSAASCPARSLPHLHVSGLSASSLAAPSVHLSQASACCGAGCTRQRRAALQSRPNTHVERYWHSRAVSLSAACSINLESLLRHLLRSQAARSQRVDRFPPHAKARRASTLFIGSLCDPRLLHAHQTSGAWGILQTSSLSFRTWRVFTATMASSMLQSQ